MEPDWSILYEYVIGGTPPDVVLLNETSCPAFIDVILAMRTGVDKGVLVEGAGRDGWLSVLLVAFTVVVGAIVVVVEEVVDEVVDDAWLTVTVVVFVLSELLTSPE
jgi:hypothetical protein